MALRANSERLLEMAGKNAALHKAFAQRILDTNDRKRFDDFIAKHPEIADIAAFKQGGEADIIRNSSNFELCEYFYVKSDLKDAYEFENDKERVKTVAQVVKDNIRAYKNIQQAIEDETDKDYIAIYKKVVAAMDKYFDETAERALADYYGPKYTDFKKEFDERKSKKTDSSEK